MNRGQYYQQTPNKQYYNAGYGKQYGYENKQKYFNINEFNIN